MRSFTGAGLVLFFAAVVVGLVADVAGFSVDVPGLLSLDEVVFMAKNNTRPAPVKLRTPTIKVKSSAKKKAQIIWNLKGNGVKYQVYYSTKKNKGYKKAATINSSACNQTIILYHKGRGDVNC